MLRFLFGGCKCLERKPGRGYHTICVNCGREHGREGKSWLKRIHVMRTVVLVRLITRLSMDMAERADQLTTLRELDHAHEWQAIAGRTNRLANDMDDIARDIFEQSQKDNKISYFN